ncbi:MAG: DUF3810 family protein [Christensenellales bacterium]
MQPRLQQKITLLHLTAIILSLLLISMIFVLLSKIPTVAEILTRTWGRLWSDGLATAISKLPFSLFEWSCFLVVSALVAIIIICIVLLAKKRIFKACKLFLSTVIVAMVVVTIYVSTATVAYNREQPPLPSIDNSLVTSDKVVDCVDNYDLAFAEVSSKIAVDEEGRSICPYNFAELSNIISAQFDRLDEDYFGKGGKRVKASAFSTLMSHNHIVGITFMPYGEATVNANAPYTDVAFAMAHELAHTCGVMREGYANLVAVYVLLTSDDDYLRYCGYLNSYYYLNLALIYSNNFSHTLSRTIPQVAKADVLREREYWSQFTLFDKIGDFFNDLYLRLNGQSGSDSYFQVNEGEEAGKDENGNVIYTNVTYTDMQRMLVAMFA